MKIEKVNDHQIRCTLTREDLLSRELKISELAYGTDKAKDLFRDMMQQAACEFGFEAEDIPLMIEAIPLNAECIVLIVTKVEDPEELDTRFARFAPSVNEDSEEGENDYSEIADEVMDLFERIHKNASSSEKTVVKDKDTVTAAKSENYIRRKLAQNINLRNTPEIRFILDQSIEYGVNMSKLIDDVNHQ